VLSDSRSTSNISAFQVGHAEGPPVGIMSINAPLSETPHRLQVRPAF
jgi:hypothetical protein